ncbi:hypothetical protein DPMN_002275 [Dreissena polymorpha]|uniref:Uncharacterized protein n=1 Tax=Dreissena polymorpha TaxID=45954 RepID=A0A9D4RTP3_DREPO|nr:hypothetical protein DPMN_002275 [Dreissena polymorpha]
MAANDDDLIRAKIGQDGHQLSALGLAKTGNNCNSIALLTHGRTAGNGRSVHAHRKTAGNGRSVHAHRKTAGNGRSVHAHRKTAGNGRSVHAHRKTAGNGRSVHAHRKTAGNGRSVHAHRKTAGKFLAQENSSGPLDLQASALPLDHCSHNVPIFQAPIALQTVMLQAHMT